MQPDRTRSVPTTGTPAPPSDDDPFPPDPSNAPDPARRRQRAGFSVFFDAPADAVGALETRIYHEESGREVVFPDADPGAWAAWMLDRIRAADDGPPPEAPVATVEADLEASVGFVGAAGARREGDRRTRRVHLTVRVGVSGIGDVERELGRAMLDALAQLRAAPPDAGPDPPGRAER